MLRFSSVATCFFFSFLFFEIRVSVHLLSIKVMLISIETHIRHPAAMQQKLFNLRETQQLSHLQSPPSLTGVIPFHHPASIQALVAAEKVAIKKINE